MGCHVSYEYEEIYFVGDFERDSDGSKPKMFASNHYEKDYFVGDFVRNFGSGNRFVTTTSVARWPNFHASPNSDAVNRRDSFRNGTLHACVQQRVSGHSGTLYFHFT